MDKDHADQLRQRIAQARSHLKDKSFTTPDGDHIVHFEFPYELGTYILSLSVHDERHLDWLLGVLQRDVPPPRPTRSAGPDAKVRPRKARKP